MGVARSATKVGFGVTVAMRLGRVGLGVIGMAVGKGVAVATEVIVAVMAVAVAVDTETDVCICGVAGGRFSTTMSSGWTRGVAVGPIVWQANAIGTTKNEHKANQKPIELGIDLPQCGENDAMKKILRNIVDIPNLT